ncbi:MAG: acyl-CoA thioesterase [Lachnospiraceae bacterium]|nr:acyl-CoA thioesterase [Lachnospiraceae bacterium]
MQYKHTVKYYETDKMKITHHSNYIRWMEEARIYFLNEIGASYKKFEEMGILSPVVSVKCKYKKTTTFEDDVFIEVSVVKFNGIKLSLDYTMKNAAGEICATAASSHCFMREDGTIVNLKRDYKDIYDIIANFMS